MTSFGRANAGPVTVPALLRDHRVSAHRRFWGKDAGFGEDRPVVRRHVRGAVIGLLGSTALNLRRGRCPLWPAAAPLTANADWIAGHPAAILAGRRKGPADRPPALDREAVPCYHS